MSDEHVLKREHRQRGRRLDLRPDERASLTAFVERFRQRYGEELLRVVLFGSKARGDSDTESGVDVLVVLRNGEHWQRLAEISDMTSQLPLESSVNISPLVCDLARYRWWAEHHAPIYNSIQRDGVELWTKHNEPSLSGILRRNRAHHAYPSCQTPDDPAKGQRESGGRNAGIAR